MKRTTILAALSALACLAFAAPSASAAVGDSFSFAPTTANGTEAPGFPGERAVWAGVCDLELGDAAVGTPPVDRKFPGCIDQPLVPCPTGFCIARPVLMPPLAPGVTPEENGPDGWRNAVGGPQIFGPSWRLEDVTDAGAHPDGSASFWFSRAPSHPRGLGGPPLGVAFGPEGQPRNARVTLPPGVLPNPNAVPQCPSEALNSSPPRCHPSTQVGVSTIALAHTIGAYPVYNAEPRDGKTAELVIAGVGLDTVYDANAPIVGGVDTEGEFNAFGGAELIPSAAGVHGQVITLWGVPWAASHDKYRPVAGFCGAPNIGSGATMTNVQDAGTAAMNLVGLTGGTFKGCSQDPQPYDPSWGPIRPFFSTQTECSPKAPVTGVYADNYHSDVEIQEGVPAPSLTGCGDISFPADISLIPTSRQADSPTGLDVELEIPQNNEPPFATPPEGASQLDVDQYVADANGYWRSKAGLAVSHLKDTVVTLPEGFSINASAANGQRVCTTDQIGLLPPRHSTEAQVIEAEANEIQEVDLDATAGTFRLSWETGKGTGSVASGSPTITGLVTRSGAFRVGDTISGSGIPPATTVLAVGSDTLTMSANGTAGAFGFLTATETTAALDFDAAAPEVQAAVEALPAFGAGNVFATGPDGGPWKIEFAGPSAGQDIAQATVNTGSLTGTATATTVAPPTFTLALGGETTAPISYGASRGQVRAALEALPSVDKDDIAYVSGPAALPAGSPWTVRFAGDLAGVDVPELVATDATLTGGFQEVSVSTEAEGGVQEGPSIRFSNDDPNDGQGKECPEASKIGTLQVQTPLLKEADWPTGEVYLAAQKDNPFNSNYAIYLVLRSVERGLVIKIAGEVNADPVTGRLTTTVRSNPQLPFDKFLLHFKGGPQAPLASPPVCGTYQNHTTLSPYSDPDNPNVITENVAVDQGPAGRPCSGSPASRPLDVGFSAGSTELVAGQHSPFTVRVTRPDGAQEIDRIEVTTPEGLVAKLAGVPYCPEAQIARAIARTAVGDGAAEQTDPSCPASSQVGTTTVGAGAGNNPFYASGNVYLAGPYKGAPVSLAFIVPAVAGPFDLGVQVVRTALRVNPKTAQVTAVSDTIPKILGGVPLRIRDVRVDIDRPDFTINPTDCSEQQVTGRVFGASGATTDVSNRFQIAECTRLGFKPKLTLRLKGGTKRTKYQGLEAIVTPRPGDANIARTSVTMPRSAFLAQEHIRTVCTRVQWAADACPKAAIYGRATAWSPLLDEPLTGSVYLRSSDNKLPDLVTDLRGPASQPIRVELSGRTDSFKGALRNTFDIVPDAPVTRFELELFGGDKGLIVNSQDLCKKKHFATVKMTGQNGRTHNFRPVVKNGCKKIQKAGKKAKQGKKGSAKQRPVASLRSLAQIARGLF